MLAWEVGFIWFPWKKGVLLRCKLNHLFECFSTIEMIFSLLVMSGKAPLLGPCTLDLSSTFNFQDLSKKAFPTKGSLILFNDFATFSFFFCFVLLNYLKNYIYIYCACFLPFNDQSTIMMQILLAIISKSMHINV